MQTQERAALEKIRTELDDERAALLHIASRIAQRVGTDAIPPASISQHLNSAIEHLDTFLATNDALADRQPRPAPARRRTESMWRIQRREYRPHTSRYSLPGETRAVHFTILDDQDRVVASVDWMPAHPRTLKEATAHAEEIVAAHNASE